MSKPNPSRFTKGDKRASEAGKKSHGHLPVEVREARNHNAVQFEKSIYNYMNYTFAELKEAFNNKKTCARDLAVINILMKAIKEGDYRCLDFLLDRTIGKVKQALELNGEVEVKNITQLLEQSETSKVIDVTPRETKQIESGHKQILPDVEDEA